MKWYRAVTWDPSDRHIEAIEVERETRQRVWVQGKPEWQKTDYGIYFRTFGEAREHLIKLAETEALTAKRQLSVAEKRVEYVKALTEGDVR